MAATHIPKGMPVVLSLDPGVVTAGWCLWEHRKWASTIGISPPLRSGVISLHRNLRSDDAIESIALTMTSLKDDLRGVKLIACVCEMPVLFAGAKGHAAARKGDLTDIAFMCGQVCEWMHSRGASFRGILASEWKGQLPKPVVNERIASVVGDAAYSILSASKSHDWDACGIGLYAQNRKVFG